MTDDSEFAALYRLMFAATKDQTTNISPTVLVRHPYDNGVRVVKEKQ